MALPPYKRFLAVLAVAALTRSHGEAWAVLRALDWHCVATGRTDAQWLTPVLMQEVYPRLDPVSQAYLATFVPGMSPAEPLGPIIVELGFERYLEVTPEGCVLKVLEFFGRWREDTNLSIFLDVCFLAGIPVATIREDVKLLWNVQVTSEDLTMYADLFIDRDLLRGSWDGYEKSYGDKRGGFVRSLVRQPHDFVRHKLGVPVSLDTERVLDRLISDSYFSEREIVRSLGGSEPSRDQLTRIKMERDTMLKVIDRRLKLADAKKGSGDDGAKVAEAALATLADMTLRYEKNDFPTIEDVTGEKAQAYSEPPKPVDPIPAAPAK